MRINFDANEAVVNLIERIRGLIPQGTSQKGAIISGLNLLMWALERQRRGNVIIAISKEDFEKLPHGFRIVQYNSDFINLTS